jgi:hypothetical protein
VPVAPPFLITAMKATLHEDISQRAYQLWENYGCPDGRDLEIWLEAERQHGGQPSDLDAKGSNHQTPRTGGESNDARALTERVKAEMASQSVVEYRISPPIPEQEAIQAALQKQESRAPILPHTTAPNTKPPESGKPLWAKPHSS